MSFPIKIHEVTALVSLAIGIIGAIVGLLYTSPAAQLVFNLGFFVTMVASISLSAPTVNKWWVATLIAAVKKYDDRESSQEAALTVEYFSHQTKHAITSISFLVPFAVGFSIFMNDPSAILIGLGYCAILLAFLALTHYRIKHGSFGSTAAEAAELIDFIATQASEGKPPDSRKVSMPLLDRVEARVREIEDNAVPQKV